MRKVDLDAMVKASRRMNAPTPDARERGRDRLMARIAAGTTGLVAVAAAGPTASAGVSDATNAGAGTPTTWAGGIPKIALVAALIAMGVATGVGVYLNRAISGRASHAASMPIPAISSTADPESTPPILSTPSAGLLASMPAGTGIRPRALSHTPAPASTGEGSNLERELQLLRSARRALTADSPGRALGLLDQYSGEFPRGVLKPEAETLRVSAMCAAGRVAEARRARDEWIAEQPNSPLADAMRATCTGVR